MKRFFKEIFMNEPWNDDWSDEVQLSNYIRDIACCFNSICYGYFDKEELIGLAMGSKRHWWTGIEYFMEEFCIKTSMQGQGIGREFLQIIEKDLKTEGIVSIRLQTERQVPAYHFYPKVGFKEVKEQVSFVKKI
ncbi:Acetyltransferase [Lachnospiraceae bacterium TWA4]|nr:Acetyltransferase [Lachnospiraceae bacterium TWA4]